jgi:hypothetical protein
MSTEEGGVPQEGGGWREAEAGAAGGKDGGGCSEGRGRRHRRKEEGLRLRVREGGGVWGEVEGAAAERGGCNTGGRRQGGGRGGR